MVDQSCMDKLLELANGPTLFEGLSEAFKALAKDASDQDMQNATMIVPLYDEYTDIEPSEYAAEFHLVVRRV